jgi:hypothetical protein
MKRFIFSLLIVLYIALITVSCGSGGRNSGEHPHEHGPDSHEHTDEMEHTGQEEFHLNDADSLEDSMQQGAEDHPHDHDHDDHQH